MFLKRIVTFSLFVFCISTLNAQPKPPEAASSRSKTEAVAAPRTESKESKESNLVFNPDASVTTTHEVTIKGSRVPYKAVAGTMPVWDEEGKTIAGLF